MSQQPVNLKDLLLLKALKVLNEASTGNLDKGDATAIAVEIKDAMESNRVMLDMPDVPPSRVKRLTWERVESFTFPNIGELQAWDFLQSYTIRPYWHGERIRWEFLYHRSSSDEGVHGTYDNFVDAVSAAESSHRMAVEAELV